MRDDSVEKYLIQKALEFNGSKDQKINCLKTLISFGKCEELAALIEFYIKDKGILNEITFSFNHTELEEILRSFVLEDTLMDQKKKFIKRLTKRSIKREIPYVWKDEDIDFLKKFIASFSEQNNTNVLGFYLAFDIPLCLSNKDLIDIAYTKIESKNTALKINFINKYDEISNVELNFLKYFEISNFKLAKDFINIIYEKDITYISTLFSSNLSFRAYIFCMLNTELQYKIALKYGFYYSFGSIYNDSLGELSKEYRPDFWGINENNLGRIGLTKECLGFFYEDLKLDQKYVIKTYHIITRQKFDSFLVQRQFSTFPVLIYDNYLNQIRLIMSDNGIVFNIREYLNECIKIPLYKDNNELYLQLEGTPYVLCCVKNNSTRVRKRWFLQRIVKFNEEFFERKLSLKNKDVIQKCNNPIKKENFADLIIELFKLDISDWCYFSRINNNFLNLCIYCRLRYAEKFKITRDLDVYINFIEKNPSLVQLTTELSMKLYKELQKNRDYKKSVVESKDLYNDYFFVDINVCDTSSQFDQLDFNRYLSDLSKKN